MKKNIIAILTLNDINLALNTVEALAEAGVTHIEMTLRTTNALDILKELSSHFPNITIGAGTITSDTLYHLAIEHGAKFIVSPGITDKLARVSLEYTNIPYFAGVATASEILLALEYKIHNLKFFPAELSGGANKLKAFFPIFPQVQFCPTGGINLENMHNYLSLSNVNSIGVSSIAPELLIKQQEFKKINTVAKQFVAALLTNN